MKQSLEKVMGRISRLLFQIYVSNTHEVFVKINRLNRIESQNLCSATVEYIVQILHAELRCVQKLGSLYYFPQKKDDKMIHHFIQFLTTFLYRCNIDSSGVLF